jgi:carbon-monoxide dehydrogenase small subunit
MKQGIELNVNGDTYEVLVDPLQKSFVEKGALQCGFCTPGMILTAKAILAEEAHPTDDIIKDKLAGNLCRCTGYTKIVEAVLSVGQQRGRGE